MDLSKMKTLEDDNLNVNQIWYGKGRKHCGKRRKCGLSKLLTCLNSEHLLRTKEVSKHAMIAWKRVKLLIDYIVCLMLFQ